MTVLDLDALVLDHGGHNAPTDGASPDELLDRAMCVMEAVAYVAGEPWSDHPQCASPVLTSFLIGLNDRWSDDARQLLKPFIPRLVGTRTNEADEETRRWMIVNWLVHEYAPAMFRHVGLVAEATEFEEMVTIASSADWQTARKRIFAVRDAQWARRREALDRLRKAAVAVAAAAAAAVAAADAAAAADADAAAAAYAVVAAAAAADADADAAAYAAAAAYAVADAVADAAAAAAAAAAADAAAAAAADAAAAAVAAADAAAVAVAAAAAAAVAAADAAADADAAAAAYAAAAADAAADALKAKIAEATTAAIAARKRGESAYSAAYRVFKPYYDERYRDLFENVGLRQSVLGLIDRLIEVGKS